MAYDISRDAFNPRKHFSGVFMQQGKPLVDDDFNEAWRIINEIDRRTQVDVIGGYGSADDGFKLINWNAAGGIVDFDISDGSIYLGGYRWEMEKAKNKQLQSVFETFRLQRDWLQKQDLPIPTANELPNGTRFDLVYLQAWRQPVCAVEDRSLFEVALGGTDTTTRLRNMRRVNIFPNTDSAECAVSWKAFREDLKAKQLGTVNSAYECIPNTKLSVSFTTGDPAEDLCTPSITGGYLGAENQAIRVQLVDNGHFTWGFDNAAPLYRVTIGENRTMVTMLTTPRDQYHWPQSGQVVELLAWSAVLPNGEKVAEQSGFLSTVAASYNPDTKTFNLATPLPAGFGEAWKTKDIGELNGTDTFFFMRVWNRGSDRSSAPAIPFTVNTPVKLGNTGLQITIAPKDTTLPVDLIAEDHWIIGARPETPDQLVPWELKEGQGIPPHGPRRFFAPLAIIRWSINAANGAVIGELIHDCRRPFNPLTEQECCCTYTVGDGVRTKGDFNSIQQAVDALPEEGGKICVLAGIHTANVLIRNRKQIVIMGCGDQTIVRPAEQLGASPIFRIEHSQRIQLDNMTLVSIFGTAIDVVDNIANSNEFTEDLTISNNRILAFIHAINVHLQDRAGNNNIKIRFNQIGMYDKTDGNVAIFTMADDVLIERNRIVVIPAPDNPQNPGGGGNDTPPTDVNDPCAKLKKIYEKDNRFRLMVLAYVKFLRVFVPRATASSYNTPGGIQVGCSSEKVWILENEITGGKGNGILLGHFEPPPIVTEEFDHHYAPITNITIEGNIIQRMGIAGIGVLVTSQDRDVLSEIHTINIHICHNKITFCALEPTEDITKALAWGGIILAFCEEGAIIGNHVEDNGPSSLFPVCGIFILQGEKIDIASNHILNNGPAKGASDRSALPGNRGGIVIRSSFKPETPKYSITTNNNAASRLLFDASPSVKINDNVVVQPLGHSLFLVAFGPVTVTGNQFTSQGVFERNVYSLLAANVFILNLGVSKDLLNIIIANLSKFKNLTVNDPSALLAALVDPATPLGRLLLLYQLLPSGKVLFGSNQTLLDLRSPEFDFALSANLIASLDDIGFTGNQAECASLVARLPTGGVTFDLLGMNTCVAGVSLRCNDNRFTDGFSPTKLSLFTFGLVNTTTDNQCTHCLTVVGFPAFEVDIHNTVIITAECQDRARKLGATFGKASKAKTAKT
jgi:hypothetical protein